MDQIATPARMTADVSEQPVACAPEAAATAAMPMLRRVLAFLVGVIIHDQEDEIVKRYEGHSWCDSTERQLNNDIMTGRHTRTLG